MPALNEKQLFPIGDGGKFKIGQGNEKKVKDLHLRIFKLDQACHILLIIHAQQNLHIEKLNKKY